MTVGQFVALLTDDPEEIRVELYDSEFDQTVYIGNGCHVPSDYLPYDVISYSEFSYNPNKATKYKVVIEIQHNFN